MHGWASIGIGRSTLRYDKDDEKCYYSLDLLTPNYQDAQRNGMLLCITITITRNDCDGLDKSQKINQT